MVSWLAISSVPSASLETARAARAAASALPRAFSSSLAMVTISAIALYSFLIGGLQVGLDRLGGARGLQLLDGGRLAVNGGRLGLDGLLLLGDGAVLFCDSILLGLNGARLLLDGPLELRHLGLVAGDVTQVL